MPIMKFVTTAKEEDPEHLASAISNERTQPYQKPYEDIMLSIWLSAWLDS